MEELIQCVKVLAQKATEAEYSHEAEAWARSALALSEAMIGCASYEFATKED